MEGLRFVLQRQHWDAITDDECRMVLRKMRRMVESFLQGRPVADRMAEEGVIEKLDLQGILEREQIKKALVEFVDVKGKGALPSFMDALLKTEQLRLYEMLLDELQRSAAAVFSCQAQLPRIGAQAGGPESSSELQLMLDNKSALQLHLTADDQHLVMCPVCERAMTDPLLLPCLHTCCRSCVDRGDQGRTADSSNADGITAAFGRRSSPIDGAERDAADSEPGIYTAPLHLSDAEFDRSAADGLHPDRVQKERLPQAVDDGSAHARSTVLSLKAGGDFQEVAAPAEAATVMSTGCSHQPVNCPVCGESLPDSGGLANRLVTKRVAQLAERMAGAMCRRCLGRGYDDVNADLRCLNCGMFMCGSCAADHNSFLKNHVIITSEEYFGRCREGSTGFEGEAKDLESGPDALCPAIRRPPVSCTVHINLIDMYCGDCEMLICSEYLKRKCLLKGHRSVEPLEVHASRARQDIGKLVSHLWPLPLHDGKVSGTGLTVVTGASAGNGTVVAAQSTEDELRVAVRLLQRSLLRPLSLGKQDLLEAVENVFEAAQDQVIEYCTHLQQQARHAEARVGGAIAYCRQLIRMGDDVCIAEQHTAVMACLHRLLAEITSCGSGSQRDDGKGSDTDEWGARAVCNNYLIIERRPLTDDCRAIIADLIGQPKSVAADRPLPLLSVLAMASDADAQLVREKKGDEPVKEKEADEKDDEQTAIGDRNREPSPTVDAAGGGADKMKAPTGQSEELDSDYVVRQLRERLTAAEDQSNDLRVQLELAEARATRLDIDLQACRATIRRLDQELEKLRQAKSEVDCDLKRLQLDPASAAAESVMYSRPMAAADRRRFGQLHQLRAFDLSSRGAGARTWPPAGHPVRADGRLQPPQLSRVLHGPGLPYAGSLPPARPSQPPFFHPPLPGTTYAAAYPDHPGPSFLLTPAIMISSDSGDVPVSQCDIEEGNVLSSSPINSSSVSSPSPSAASGQQVLATDRSSYQQWQEIRWPSGDGDTEIGLALKLLWTQRLDIKCFGVAVARNGIAAIATDKGLLLYDCTGRRQLLQVGVGQSYRCVAAVPDASDAQLGESVQSGRTMFVAGNKSAKSVELLVLSFSGPAVICDAARVLLKDNLPWCVAVDGEGRTVAVSSGRFVRTVLLDGSSEWATPFSIGYTVSALAYGCQALLVGSSEKKKDGLYALEARDASNIDHQLWTLWLDEAISGLLCDRHSHCYVLLARSRVLRIYSITDDVQCAKVVQCANVTLGSQLPSLAFDRNDQWLMLLQGDNTLVLFATHDVQGQAKWVYSTPNCDELSA